MSIKKLFKKLGKKRGNPTISQQTSPTPMNQKFQEQLPRDLEQKRQFILDVFGDTTDLMLEDIIIGKQRAFLCYITTMTDGKTISEKVVTPLSIASTKGEEVNNEDQFLIFIKEKLAGTRHSFIKEEQGMVQNLLTGAAILCVDGVPKAASIHIEGITYRSIEEPSTQTIIRGPKDGFTESSDNNISLIRRRIKNPSLRFEKIAVGTETQTNIIMVYIKGVTNTGVVQEVRKRIQDVKSNAILDSGILEEFIQDKTWTPFPLVYNSERPDAIASHLLTGKVAIIVDGSPFVLSVPTVLGDFFQVSEDYYQPFMMSSFVRLIRYVAWMLSLVFPSIYVSLITFHHELIPTTLLFNVMSQRSSIPFPAIVEVFIMEITFEILREAGVRMPRAVGPTVSIVGGLVIGQAAVEAGVISNFMVIVVALTAISSFVSPIYSFSVSARILRFGLVLMAGFMGLFGVVLALIVLIGHLSGLRSFGVPYLAPFAPFMFNEHGDMVLRFPIFSLKKRPSYLQSETPVKQPNAESPSPPRKDGFQP